MASPFPGMDPYLERSEIWSDFHDRFITYICSSLQAHLRPKYLALTQDRLYVVESNRPRWPDVAVVKTGKPGPVGSVAVLEPDAPQVFELWRDEIRQPLLTIVEPAAGNRIVTAMEVLSPSNKAPGEGRDSYLEKREEFWRGAVNLVEIDLLREGEPTVRLTEEQLQQLPPWNYLVAVSRRYPSRQEVYGFPLAKRLPKVSIPLGKDDADMVLDLQLPFTRCWEEGPYPELLRYEGNPLGPMTAAEVSWCEGALKAAGFR